ncbi:hypothetical protein ERO13_A09G132300v2 [Gossypium hirsutum]|uniref:Uncharacterized protein n=2 Tax=Gossypium TaxID=3633 RepID=A0A1U8HZJ9_GOSHI|nr:uncharacterized protein LOC107889459 [Gossypium hirsutum]KAG4183802.1 hypothetical protein ERO13_A09G132300v2 [Gossypium hirsutum]TYI10675.1 hypothetical protein ES332_A09G157700v1 [Gossypium tomentosum]
MSRQIIFRTPTSVQRRQPLLQSGSSSNSFCSSSTDDGGSSSSTTRSSSRNSAKFGEFCGGTTAECAVICCCCPCTIANLLVLAFYKVPAGLCRRALRLKRRRKLREKGLLQPKNHRPHCGIEDNSELQIHTVVVEDFFPDVEATEEAEKAVMELEKEMWQRFYGTGFWKSPSQREGEPPRIKQL